MARERYLPAANAPSCACLAASSLFWLTHAMPRAKCHSAWVVGIDRSGSGSFMISSQRAKRTRETLEILGKLFQYRTCDGPEPGRRSGVPCLDYYIKRCQAPCVGYIDREEYRRNIEAIAGFLSGRYRDVERDLERKMEEAAGDERYERAAVYRDRLEAVRSLMERRAVVLAGGLGGTPDDTIVASGVGQHQMWTSQYWRFNHPYTWVNSGGNNAIGRYYRQPVRLVGDKGREVQAGTFHALCARVLRQEGYRVILALNGETGVEIASSDGISTDPQNNAGATVLKEKDLEALPDDPDELAEALSQLSRFVREQLVDAFLFH